MKLKFKIQPYQTEAVENVARVFDGQPNLGLLKYEIEQGSKSLEMNIKFDETEAGYKNADIVLDEETLLKNIHHIQTENNIQLSSDVVKKLGHCQLDVEMETGTGKTYVYIKTLFELNRRYGWTKFIVVVPSVAIREGVKKSFDITADHFMELYGKKANYFIYNSDRLFDIESFSQSADISVMIINTQAFNTSLKEGAKNKAARIIYDKRDSFRSRRPIDIIAANRPIIILDEPQKMGGAATQKALARFNPLFTLNYSATHKETHNPVYVLDALDAYNKKLVKKIEVVGFELKNLKGTNGYLYLADFILSKDKAPQARIELELQTKSGKIKRDYKNVSKGKSLYELSGEMEQYRGYTIAEINIDDQIPSRSSITLDNGITLHLKEVVGNVTADHKVRIQIRETIKAHFRKEAYLFKRGIKCLSLFFIDEVANYRKYDDDGQQLLGRYGEIFEQEYIKELNEQRKLLNPDYASYLNSVDVKDTHTGYFSIDKKGHSVNSTIKRGSDSSDDISAYDLILKNKERLLSLDEPVRFIFSHSALREGWDNPNVFQICSLRQSNSESQKHQEIGRGLRLCVDSRGVRQDSDVLSDDVHKINRLTVIASEGYASYVSGLQNEIRTKLYDRPQRADTDFFTGKIFTLPDESKHTVTKDEAKEIWFQLRTNGYITKVGEVTELFHNDLQNETLESFDEELQPYTDQIYKCVQSIFDPHVINDLIDDGSKPQIPENRLNDNFAKKEFQELWHRINHKYAYTVDFDSEELIDKAVTAINNELNVSRLSYVVTRGEQKDQLTHEEMESGHMLQEGTSNHEEISTDVVSHVKYDLLGKIGTNTKLTRKTVASILSKILTSKFNYYKMNPEEFISKVSRIIMEQKATIIVDHISYNPLNGDDNKYTCDIFTQEKHTTIDKAYRSKKSIMDYVFIDGKVEHDFVEKIDNAKEVVVYAKLPKGFHIPTPVGKYSPDWAIAFQEGRVRHIYFVAETKGSMSSLDLRGIEKNKIACAEKLFNQLSSTQIRYGKVDSFDELMIAVNGE